MNNKQYRFGQAFVEGLFGKITNVIKAKPSERLKTIMGDTPQTNVTGALTKSAQVINKIHNGL